jgi:hypothetical protein
MLRFFTQLPGTIISGLLVAGIIGLMQQWSIPQVSPFVLFLAGIVGAITATLLIYVLGNLVGRRGISSGAWKTQFTEHGKKCWEDVNLRTLFWFFFGSTIVVGDSIYHEEGKTDATKYNIVGLEYGDILVAAYLSGNKTSAERGVFLIEFNNLRNAASGIISGYRDNNFSKESSEYEWKKE